MIFLKLFWVFSYIGLLNFGGGYAMLSFIQQEVVVKYGWMSESEFTDIVAISQMTPGPIGINCATYVGYTSVVNDPAIQALDATIPHATHLCGIAGSILATLSVLWLPFIVMILVSHLILRHKDSPVLKSIFGVLRPVIIGLLASAALSLMTTENFGRFDQIAIGSTALWSVPSVHAMIQCTLSILTFGLVLVGIMRWRWNIIYTTLICGAIGVFVYGFVI